ncbi:MAG TPA: hypothetical protein VFE54_00635 [Mucilaginibacter sp.]|jgi:tetratricopeptide (TPR) repeat protein|nr:hypothetical protein [Mucilaginibacter sp.]
MNNSLTKDQKAVAALVLTGLSLLQNGRYAEALPYLNEYISMLEGLNQPLTADDAIYYYNRSVAKVGLDDIDGAIEDLNKCVAISKIHQAYFQLFKLHDFKRDSRAALDALIDAYENGNTEAEAILREHTNYFNR